MVEAARFGARLEADRAVGGESDGRMIKAVPHVNQEVGLRIELLTLRRMARRGSGASGVHTALLRRYDAVLSGRTAFACIPRVSRGQARNASNTIPCIYLSLFMRARPGRPCPGGKQLRERRDRRLVCGHSGAGNGKGGKLGPPLRRWSPRKAT